MRTDELILLKMFDFKFLYLNNKNYKWMIKNTSSSHEEKLHWKEGRLSINTILSQTFFPRVSIRQKVTYDPHLTLELNPSDMTCPDFELV